MIEAKNIAKIFKEGESPVTVLNGLNLEISPQSKIGIVGRSGSGKSTLLHILGGLDSPTHGQVLIEGENLYALPEARRAQLRNRSFGFVFQFYHLLPELSVLENVALPAWIAGLSPEEGKKQARQVLGRVGLDAKQGERPMHLSGGEQQRVALARALCLKPSVILADEPTGNLDEETGSQVMRYLLEVAEETKGSLVLVTHNLELTKEMDQVWELKDGRLQRG